MFKTITIWHFEDLGYPIRKAISDVLNLDDTDCDLSFESEEDAFDVAEKALLMIKDNNLEYSTKELTYREGFSIKKMYGYQLQLFQDVETTMFRKYTKKHEVKDAEGYIYTRTEDVFEKIGSTLEMRQVDYINIYSRSFKVWCPEVNNESQD